MNEAKKRWKEGGPKGRRLVILVVGPAVLAVVSGYFYLFGNRYMSTDNAYLKADKVSISAEVSGRVADVKIANNSRVTAGQLLFSLDAEPYTIAVHHAEANLAVVKAGIEGVRAEYQQKVAAVEKAQEDVRYWAAETVRYKGLVRIKAAPDTKADEVTHTWQVAIKELDEKQQELQEQLAKLGGNPDIVTEDHPSYRQALADLEKAKLNLEHVNILSPLKGIAANVSLKPGEFVALGMPLFSVVDDGHIWVEANFKETDLTHVRAGQDAMVEVDTYPGMQWKAKVASITPATGSEFSILPAQNASGNWVKVVQRIMVRLEFEDDQATPPLAVGMSAYVTIDTGHSRLGRWFGNGEATP